MRRVHFFLLLILGLAAPTMTQAEDLILPAGTLLRCTLEEPKFSSKTAQVGDPIVCYVAPVSLFGRSAFPRGAYLGGEFEDYRDPGRFFGNGWIKLTFDRLVLPSQVIPLSARVISVPALRVDREGKIHGRGHPRRDALGWAIPIFWPVKVLTLPMRGPRPTLTGEIRLVLRLLEDVPIAIPVAASSRVPSSTAKPLQASAKTDDSSSLALSNSGSHRSNAATGFLSRAVRFRELRPDVSDSSQVREGQRETKLTVLMFQDGIGCIATDYWVEGGQLRYLTSESKPKVLPLERLDLAATVELNRERGVEFVLRPKPASQ